MLFVAKIHNNSLGICILVSSWDEGRTMIREMAEKQLGRSLDDDELADVENGELCNIDDINNVYTWSLGTFEGE